MGPRWSTIPLGPDAAAALAQVPARPGVVEILGPDERNLMIGRGAEMRRWAATHLGLGPPPAKGMRPPIDLRAIATAIRFSPTGSGFQQRMVYERVMARHVPLEKRRDLKVPGYLRLDESARFPRLEVVVDPQGGSVHGPFRDKAAAQKAAAALHKELPLRPCDFTFEPHAELPLGLACLYAQVSTCAAPCLVRCSEGDYRALATRASAWLSSAQARASGEHRAFPDWIAPIALQRAVVVEPLGERVELHPVFQGNVMEDQAGEVETEGLGAALAGFSWHGEAPLGADLPWLSSWLHGPRRTGRYVVLPQGPLDAMVAAVHQGLEAGAE